MLAIQVVEVQFMLTIESYLSQPRLLLYYIIILQLLQLTDSYNSGHIHNFVMGEFV